MKRLLAGFIAFVTLLSCQSNPDVPFTRVQNYYFRNDAQIPEHAKIDTREAFESLFGSAAYMGKDGQPTRIDWDKEFVIAVVNPVTDSYTELTPVSLKTKSGELIFTYHETVGEKQTWSMQPILLIKVSREYEADSVQVVKQ